MNRSSWNQPSIPNNTSTVFSIVFTCMTYFHENQASWTEMSNVFTKCYTTLENSFFKSLESLFLNYVFFRSMLALYSVWMIAQRFSVQLYIFLVSRAYRTKALTRWLLLSSSSCTCVVCMFKLYVSKAHLNRKLNHRRLDEKQQRSDRNHAFWEQWFLGLCSSVSEFICGRPHICAEKKGRTHVARSRLCCHCNCYMDEYVEQTERQ